MKMICNLDTFFERHKERYDETLLVQVSHLWFEVESWSFERKAFR